MISVTKSVTPLHRREAQAYVAAVECGQNRGLAGVKLVGEDGSTEEHFVPFAVTESSVGHARRHSYAGLIAALDRLRGMRRSRLLVMTDDQLLVEEIERRCEPPRELYLQYVILGCKLNELSRARVIAVPSDILEKLRAKTASLAQAVYRGDSGSSRRELMPLPLAPAI
ncbi:MAG: hypothetical protein DLM53_03865 [Candidatus Eremiobacter antarcticus]|nr:hypothetical protein [Candidatus Eremiobacteraeota bacterium]MBC5807410.1 hypothetical protein [Candidatus Eremiobacteraeota bacterium]PZR63157.1 MAG: hypothetical protein DLM53_03865 [Candidatus Eremiobacter sp. RRmetagenome_bin22]